MMATRSNSSEKEKYDVEQDVATLGGEGQQEVSSSGEKGKYQLKRDLSGAQYVDSLFRRLFDIQS